MSFCFETGSYNVALELEDQAALEHTESLCLPIAGIKGMHHCPARKVGFIEILFFF